MIVMATKKGLPVLVIIVAILAAFGGGYYVLSSGMLPGGPAIPGISTASRATEKDFAFIEDPLIRKHFVAMANTRAFRSRGRDIIGAEGSFNVFEVEIQGDMDGFYNWHEDNGKKNGEMISIGDTTYVKDYKDNTWWKQTVKPEEKPQNEDVGEREPKDFKEEFKSLEGKAPTYEKLGEEKCDGLMCYKYKEVDTEIPEASRTFWFDKTKFLLRKEEYGFGEWRISATYEYGNIRITAPSPTKDVPEGKSVYEYLGGGGGIPASAAGGGGAGGAGVPSQEEINKMMQQYQSAPADGEEGF